MVTLVILDFDFDSREKWDVENLWVLRKSDARLILQLQLARGLHVEAIYILQGPTQCIKQHPVGLDDPLDDQLAVGSRGPDGAEIIYRSEIDLRQPTGTARAEIPELMDGNGHK